MFFTKILGCFFFLLSLPYLTYAEKILKYEIYYASVKLGESQIILRDKEVEAIVYTTGVGNFLYPYRATWTTQIKDNTTFYPLRTTINSKDRFKERKKIIHFRILENKVTVEKILPKPKREEYKISFPIYDELTGFVASWFLNYKEGAIFNLPLYIKEERFSVQITYQKEIPCVFRNQTATCLEIKVLLPQKSELLKRSKEITYLLLSKERIPLEIRGKVPIFVTLIGKLVNF